MLKFIVFILLAVMLLSCDNLSEKEIKENLNYYLIGVSQYKMRDYNNAIISFKEDYRKTKNPESLFKLAEISVSTGDPHNAEDYLKKILAKNKKNNRAIFELAFLYKKMGRYNKSVKYFARLLDDKNYLDDAYYHIIDIYVYSFEVKEAISLFESGLEKIKKKYKIEYVFLNHFYDRDKDKYKKYFDDILNNAKDYKVLNKLVDFFFMKEDIKSAFLVLKKMEIYYPKDAQTLTTIGQIHLRNEDFSKAKEYFEKAEKFDKKNILNKINLATAEFYKNNLLKAEIYLKEAIGIKRDSIESLLLIGLVYYLKGDKEKSDKMIETIKKNTLEAQVKSYEASNPLIEFYFLSMDLEKNNNFPNKNKIINFVTGDNIKLLSMKAKILNEMGLYNDVVKLKLPQNIEDTGLIKELIIANIFLKKEKEAYALLSKLKENKEVYNIWLDYSFKKKCNGLDKKYEKNKKNNIFIDIYTNCLIKQKKFKESRKIINDFINNNDLSQATIDYLKKKIVVINYNLIQQQ